MTPATLLAEAADADREADLIFARADAARGDSNVLRVAGFEGELERASDLRRRARAVRADASQIAQDSLPQPCAPAPAAPDSPKIQQSTAPAPAPLQHCGASAVDTIEAVAARILASDSPSAEEVARQIIAAANLAEVLDPAAYPLSEAEQAAAIVERILKA